MKRILMAFTVVALVILGSGPLYAALTHWDSAVGVPRDLIVTDISTLGSEFSVTLYDKLGQQTLSGSMESLGLRRSYKHYLKRGMRLACQPKDTINVFTRARIRHYDCRIPLQYFLKPGESRAIFFTGVLFAQC